MSQAIFIIDQIKRAYSGDAWHGPSIFEILEGVDADVAVRRLLSDAHTIWELTLHVAGWDHVVVRRLRGQVATLEGDENFPTIVDASDAAWNEALKLMRANHEELLYEVSILPDARLEERVPGKDYNVRFMLHGAVQHALYHAGQMALLKKAVQRNS